MGVLVVGMEDGLGESLAVAEVDEDDAAVVAVGVDPAGEGDVLADIGFAEDATGMGSAEGHGESFLKRCGGRGVKGTAPT